MTTNVLARLPEQGEPDLLLLLFHGVGANAEHMAVLATRLAQEYPARAWEAKKDLLVIELNQTLYQHLRTRFPEAYVMLADARELKRVAEQSGYLADGPADGIISGLGLLSMPKDLQHDILHAAFSVLAPNGRFIQFTYGPTNPVAREVMRDLELTSHRAGFTLWNVPPATVYVYSRSKSKRVHPVKASPRP